MDIVQKIKDINLEREPSFHFGASLSVEKMRLKVNIEHYKPNFFSVDIVFETFECINIFEESHFYLDDLDEKLKSGFIEITPFLFLLNGNSTYFKFMKNSSSLGITEINDSKDLKCYGIESQNLIIDIITKEEPIFKF